MPAFTHVHSAVSPLIIIIISISNSMVSCAIWEKHARVSFSLNSQILVFPKFHEKVRNYTIT